MWRGDDFGLEWPAISQIDYSALDDADLLQACLDTAQAAPWEEFVRRFQPGIAAVVARVAREWRELSAALIDDLVQETYLKLCADGCRILRQLRPAGEGAVAAYIKVVAANVARDRFRNSHAEKRGAQQTQDGQDAEAADPSQASRAERQVLMQQIDSRLRSLLSGPNAPRDYAVFWLYYRHGYTARAISELPAFGLTVKGVESTILRLTRLVQARLARAANASGSDEEGKETSNSFV